jgi:hypothetical protein
MSTLLLSPSEAAQRLRRMNPNSGAQSFKQGDVTKVIKGAVKAGFKVGRIEIEDGKIIVFGGDAASSDTKVDSDVNEWDSVK